MQLVLIYGLPATGKLTVARALAERTGYRLFHNHLTVDLLLAVFDFGSAPFIELREQIWLAVIDQAARSGTPGMIFTFNPESTVRRNFIDRVAATVEAAGGQLTLVELRAPVEELRRRLADPSRQEYRKLSSPTLFDQLLADGSLDTSHMPAPALAIDTASCSPEEAARRIESILDRKSAPCEVTEES
jgi:chloramphenicol 3-O-phosphotransferase